MPTNFLVRSLACLTLAALGACAKGADGNDGKRDLAGTGSDTDGGAADGGFFDGSLLGVWSLSGTDSRGAYDGQLELRSDGMGSIEQANFTMKDMATADWSGTHLGFVQAYSLWLLAEKKPLPGFDAKASVKKDIETMRSNFQPFRMGLWSVLFAKLAGTPSAIDADNARWRLREMPAPKPQLVVDHRVGADFVMSPYPELPWKNDWATGDRT